MVFGLYHHFISPVHISLKSEMLLSRRKINTKVPQKMIDTYSPSTLIGLHDHLIVVWYFLVSLDVIDGENTP